jgi:hypothetical protein
MGKLDQARRETVTYPFDDTVILPFIINNQTRCVEEIEA